MKLYWLIYWMNVWNNKVFIGLFNTMALLEHKKDRAIFGNL